VGLVSRVTSCAVAALVSREARGVVRLLGCSMARGSQHLCIVSCRFRFPPRLQRPRLPSRRFACAQSAPSSSLRSKNTLARPCSSTAN